MSWSVEVASAIVVAGVLAVVLGLGAVLLRRRRRAPAEWELLLSDQDRSGQNLTVVKIGDRDAFRVRVSGARCTVDVTTEGVSGELRLPDGFSLPVVRLGSALRTVIRPDPALEGPAELVIEWWDWSEPTSGRRGRRRHQTRFALDTTTGRTAAA